MNGDAREFRLGWRGDVLWVRCAECCRIVRGRIPALGDGTGAFPYQHRPPGSRTSRGRCAGAYRIISTLDGETELQ